MTRAPLALFLATPMLLAACMAPSSPDPAPRTPGHTGSKPDGVCAASALQHYVGKQVNDVDLSGNDPMRIVPPGVAVTMDYNPSRLNVSTDANGIIIRLHCG